MENRNELSDIVLEKGDTKSIKLKRILIIVAFLIVLFLIALATMKMLNQEPQKESSKLILPPEPTAQEAPKTKDDQLFKQVPIIEENPKKESFEEMIKTLKEKEAQKSAESKPQEATAPAEPKAPQITTPEPPKVETKIKETPVAKETPKPKAPSTPVSTPSASAGIYVQIGAVATAPSQKVLSDIKSKGFEYRLYPTTINGKQVTKILVGPYANDAEAKKGLQEVKQGLNPNAFIYKVK